MGEVAKIHFSQTFVATCLRVVFWINFGSILGAKMVLNGSQEGSKRVSKSNAYFWCNFGSKKLALEAPRREVPRGVGGNRAAFGAY